MNAPPKLDLPDGIVFLARHMLHVEEVRRGLRRIARDLDERAEVHDLSKLGHELPGFVRLAAPCAAYGTEEYRASIESERPTVEEHYRANSHHPQHYADAASMPLLDVVEMVCDWRGAAIARGGDFRESVRIGLAAHLWTEGQRWVIEQVAELLGAGS